MDAPETGGEHLARLLAAEGVEVVFGIIDGSYFGLYSRLGAHGIRLVTPRHETSAVHMAGAYARLTGRLGVALASNGPGVANALPGVAVEQGEGNRVLLLTSWRRHGVVGPDRGGAYQYFDQPAAIAPMAKWSQAVPSPERLGELFRKALRRCWAGRPGVVHLCVPEDFLNAAPGDGAPAPSVVPDPAPARYRRTRPLPADPGAVAEAAALLAGARAPLVHAGSGVLHAGAADLLADLAGRLAAPVTTSWAARDAVDERSDHAVPMTCTDLCRRARTEADVVLVVGSRLGETDWWGKAPHWARPAEQLLAQVDVDEEAFGLNRPVDLALHGDAREVLAALLAALDSPGPAAALAGALPDRAARLAAYGAERAAALAALDAARAAPGVGAPDPGPAGVRSAEVAVACQEVFGDDAVLVADGGNTAIWAQLYWQVRRPGSLLSTFRFGMLGAGVAQALGARVACPDRPVVCITGDGAFGFHPMELETAVRHGLPVVVVVLADRQWGMVKVNQEFALDAATLVAEGGLPPERTINADLEPARYDLMAAAMGAVGLHVDSPDGLRPALRRAADAGRPAVVHVDVDRRAHKFAPSLLTFKEMHAEPPG